ncbi:MAG: thiamine phosphate synthase [Siphonobacter aquaeclarae]|nr:thiamine phosphate synthase [Siphonobacter aquaeclarae]
MIASLHYLVTNARQAEEACRGGVRWIQLRLKNTPYEAWKETALSVQEVCIRYNTILIINDNPKLAKEIGANGVHLGKEDMPVAEARRLLGPDFLIGGTANTFEDVLRHVRDGADYVGLGPFRFTQTKEKLSPILGLTGYEHLLNRLRHEAASLPVIAIGGITATDIPALFATGIHGIAVSSAIHQSPDPEGQARHFLAEIHHATASTC